MSDEKAEHKKRSELACCYSPALISNLIVNGIEGNLSDILIERVLEESDKMTASRPSYSINTDSFIDMSATEAYDYLISKHASDETMHHYCNMLFRQLLSNRNREPITLEQCEMRLHDFISDILNKSAEHPLPEYDR